MSRGFIRLVLLLLILGLGGLVRLANQSVPDETGTTGSARSSSSDAGALAIVRAFEQQQSGVVVECTGVVSRILGDDEVGSRHQRFIVTLSSGHTVLVSHNIDIARRVPIAEGDQLEFRGDYEWNERGGVVHWTHRDPQRRRSGGWILHAGKMYE